MGRLSLRLAEPDGATGVAQTHWQMSLNKIAMLHVHVVVEVHHFERGVVLQKCAEHLVFSPRTAFINPTLREFKGKEDVVEVNNNAGFQPWQNSEEHVVHVTVDLRHVG